MRLPFSVLACALSAHLSAAAADPPGGAHSSEAAHWEYGGEHGPAHWGELSPQNAACSIGREQSPLDLDGATPSDIDAPNISWSPVAGGMVVNNGHTIQVDLTTTSMIRLGGADFQLKQFHFHHPAEHIIAGRAEPMEIHFVHAGPNGRLAVIGVLVSEGPANPAFDPIWATAPAREGRAAVAFAINPSAFLPANRAAFRYAGSLTTPPCSETVEWTVFAQPITASKAQIEAFARLYPNNARPAQPRNRRFVLKSPG